jgi:hypothetical protein
MGFWYRVSMTPPAFMKEEIYRQSMGVDLRFLKRITRLFGQSMRKGELRKLNAGKAAAAFYQLLVGFAMTAAFYPSMSSERSIRDSVAIFWSGIGPGR